MGLLFILICVGVIVMIVGCVIEQKYKAQMQALIDEINELRTKSFEPQKEKNFETFYKGETDEGTIEWGTKYKK